LVLDAFFLAAMCIPSVVRYGLLVDGARKIPQMIGPALTGREPIERRLKFYFQRASAHQLV
jgi:hypothetical protein